MGPYSAPATMRAGLNPPPPAAAPVQPPAPAEPALPEITFDLFAFLSDDPPALQLLQDVLDAPPASVPAVLPPPVPTPAAGPSCFSQTGPRQTGPCQTAVAPKDPAQLQRARGLMSQLPRVRQSDLPPGVTPEAARLVMFNYLKAQERSNVDSNILIHKLAKRNKAAELARFADLMIGFKHKTHVHTKNRHGETPLHVATGAESARVLLKRGARLDARDLLGNTPLHLAARYQRSEVLAVLLESAPDYSLLDTKNLEGYTALHLVVIHQPLVDPHRRALQLLIDYNVDINVADDTGGRSALFHAVLRGDELAVRELVENNAAVNMADFSETTPLQAAEDVLPADDNHICSILLERGGFKVPPADRVTRTGRRGGSTRRTDA